MIVVDPMHNLLLGALLSLVAQGVTHHRTGLVKTHFYNIWNKLEVLSKTKELRHLNYILAQVRSDRSSCS